MRHTILIVLLVMLHPLLAQAQGAPSHPITSHPTHVAISPKLGDLPLAPPALDSIDLPPVRKGPSLVQDGPSTQRPAAGVAPARVDGSIDIHPNVQFPGISKNLYNPPDSNIAVGRTQIYPFSSTPVGQLSQSIGLIVQAVNVQVAVYTKTGTLVSGPVNLHTFWQPLGGPCGTNDGGDPIVQYDVQADRWLISQVGSFKAPYYQCFAISTTNDPTGSWYQYAYGLQDFNDYPKISVWPTATNSAYLATYNLFSGNGFFQGADLCAYDRSAMLQGFGIGTDSNSRPAQICITAPSGISYLPADFDGAAYQSTTAVPQDPPLFLALESTTKLKYYTLNNLSFSASPNPAPSLSSGTAIGVDGYAEACNGGVCIPQPGTNNKLDSLGDRLMYRLAYRVFSNYAAMVVNHSVTAGSRVGVRWYELRRATRDSSFSLYQSGTLAPSPLTDNLYRLMGSAAMNKKGDIAIGYSRSSLTTSSTVNGYPSIYFAYRKGSSRLDAGILDGYDQLLISGAGAQTKSSRWGDYTSLRIDPDNDLTFWYTNEYYTTSSKSSWNTDISSFTLP